MENNTPQWTVSGDISTYHAAGWVGTIHRATLRNLEPGKTYYYRVGDGRAVEVEIGEVRETLEVGDTGVGEVEQRGIIHEQSDGGPRRGWRTEAAEFHVRRGWRARDGKGAASWSSSL
jgi:hypothetical protein